MSAFNELWEAAQKGKLLLVDGGMCLYNHRRDGVVVIYAIIVLPERHKKGVGRKLLRLLEKLNPAAIEAKCPEDLPSNSWYEKVGFVLASKEPSSKAGRPAINKWRKELDGRGGQI